MKIVVAPNAFKGSFSSFDVAHAMVEGLISRFPGATVVSCPMADGGDGTMDVVVAALKGHYQALPVRDALCDVREARVGWVDSSTVVIEMAAMCGLAALAVPAPLTASSEGVGDALRGAVLQGAHRAIVCVGGSASTDGGTGLARALGWRFVDGDGDELPAGGGALAHLNHIESPFIDPLTGLTIDVVCDVTNPLVGPLGAAYTFGPQKGATLEQCRWLDDALGHLAGIATRLGIGNSPHAPMSGAAGGAAFGLATFAHARLLTGGDYVADLVDLDGFLSDADLVVTAEGIVDATTGDGKAPLAVARHAATLNIPCGIVGAHVRHVSPAFTHHMAAATARNEATLDDIANATARLATQVLEARP